MQLKGQELCATMVMSDWLVDHPTLKGGWKCVLTIPGVLFAMTLGAPLMLMLSVPNLAMHHLVSEGSVMDT